MVERTNVRTLTLDQIGGAPAQLVVGDLSFISLTLVLPALAACTEPDADLVLMVKPQFEVGRERLGAGGVVRDPQLRADAVRTWRPRRGPRPGRAGRDAPARCPGPAGNVEFFLWLRRGAPALDPAQLEQAVLEGPVGAS